jgi:hypothetical protein
MLATSKKASRRRATDITMATPIGCCLVLFLRACRDSNDTLHSSTFYTSVGELPAVIHGRACPRHDTIRRLLRANSPTASRNRSSSLSDCSTLSLSLSLSLSLARFVAASFRLGDHSFIAERESKAGVKPFRPSGFLYFALVT